MKPMENKDYVEDDKKKEATEYTFNKKMQKREAKCLRYAR